MTLQLKDPSLRYSLLVPGVPAPPRYHLSNSQTKSLIYSLIHSAPIFYCVIDLEMKTVIKMDKVHVRAQRTPSLKSNNKRINKSL